MGCYINDVLSVHVQSKLFSMMCITVLSAVPLSLTHRCVKKKNDLKAVALFNFICKMKSCPQEAEIGSYWI